MPCQNKPDQFVDSLKLKPLNQLEIYLKYTKPWVQSRVVWGSAGGGAETISVLCPWLRWAKDILFMACHVYDKGDKKKSDPF